MAEVAGFQTLIQTLEGADFFIGVLPFVLTYAVFFITLSNMPKFGEEGNERVTILTSVVIAFFVSYFIISTAAYQTFFIDFFGTLTVGLFGLIGLMAAMTITGLYDYFPGKAFWLIPTILLGAAAFTVAGGFSVFYTGTLGTSQVGTVLMQALDYMLNTGLIWVLILFGAVAFTVSGGEEEKEGNSLLDLLNRDLGPGENE